MFSKILILLPNNAYFGEITDRELNVCMNSKWKGDTKNFLAHKNRKGNKMEVCKDCIELFSLCF